MKKPHIFHSLNETGLASLLITGGVGVMPTDTLYGIVGSALKPESIKRIYELKKRDTTKPCILLAAGLEQLLEIDGLDRNTLLNAERFWPGAVTVVVSCQAHCLPDVQRGTKSIACRVPDNAALRSLLEITGPLIAPSANTEGAKPAATFAEAQSYFGDKVDFYVDAGEITKEAPSTIIEFDEDGLVNVLRQGSVQVDVL